MSLLQPGEHFEGLEIVGNPSFAARAPRPKRTPREQMFLLQALHAAEQAQEAGLPIEPEQLRAFNPDLPLKHLRELMTTERFIIGCEERGIALSQMAGLTAEQSAALAIYLDTSTTATHAQKLRMAGITDAKWRGWLKQRAFSQRLADVSGALLRESTPVAFQRIAEGVDRGERWAIEMSMEITGVHDRRGDGVDVTDILRMVFSALDESGVPAELMERLAGNIKAKMGLGAPQLHASPVRAVEESP